MELHWKDMQASFCLIFRFGIIFLKTQGKLFHLSEPQSLYLKNGNNNSSLTGLLQDLNEMLDHNTSHDTSIKGYSLLSLYLTLYNTLPIRTLSIGASTYYQNNDNWWLWWWPWDSSQPSVSFQIKLSST